MPSKGRAVAGAFLLILAEIRSLSGAAKVILSVWTDESLRGRFARGAVWSLLGAVISQGSNLVASMITARLLGPEEFGRYGMIQSTMGMLGIFAALGLGITATKYVAELRTRDPDRAGRIIALGCTIAIGSGGLLALFLFAYAPFIASETLNDASLVPELRIACVLLFLNAINGAQTGALSGFEAFRATARINFVRGVIALPVTVTAVMLWGLPGAVWSLVVTSAVTCCLSQRALQHECAANGIRPRLSTSWTERRILWTFSTPAFLSGALAGPIIWAANTMLVNQPSGYSEMGILSAASQWRYAIGFVPGVLGQFALPLMANLNGERDVQRYGQALKWNLVLTTTAALIVALPVALSATQIMKLYGSGFVQGAPVLVLSAASAVLTCANGVVGTAILSSGSVWVGFAFNAMWATVFLMTCHYLIPTNLAAGLAASMLCAYTAHTIWQAAYLRSRL